jgi:DNA-binding response OmpR family regulator
MPEMDGFSLYEKLKKLDNKVIICFLTATNDTYFEILKKNYPNINVNCIIHKPVDNESLLRQINSILCSYSRRTQAKVALSSHFCGSL